MHLSYLVAISYENGMTKNTPPLFLLSVFRQIFVKVMDETFTRIIEQPQIKTDNKNTMSFRRRYIAFLRVILDKFSVVTAFEGNAMQ
jgi:hypothetical protein